MKTNTNGQLYAALLSVGLLDVGVWAWLVMSQPAAPAVAVGFIVLRGLLSGLVVGLVRGHGPLQQSLNTKLVGLLAAILCYLGSCFGILAMGLVLRKFSAHTLQTGKLHHIDQEEGETPEADSQTDDEVMLEELLKVAPLADGMTDDQKEIRIATVLAMEEIMEDKNAESIRRILMESGNDPLKEVQFYAHEALKKLGDEYTERIKTLMNVVNTSDNPGYEVFKELADLYEEFAATNIEHLTLIKFYRQEAVKYYAHLLKHYPDKRNQILQQFIPALYQNKEYERCLQYCEDIRQETGDPTLRSLCQLYTARCLFDTRQMAALKQFARQAGDSDIPAMTNFLKLCERGHNE